MHTDTFLQNGNLWNKLLPRKTPPLHFITKLLASLFYQIAQNMVRLLHSCRQRA